MLQAVLYRYENTPQHTRGIFVFDGKIFYTIERPWLDNRRNISCIPKGDYIVHYMKSSASGKYKNVFHIRNVRGRGGILIHNGNLVSHSKGCVILGSKAGRLGKKAAVLSSKSAMLKLNQLAKKQVFKLRVL